MTTEQPLVSVAIITFNQKKFLKACIDSVLAQDYESIEIVVADDGSSDGTHEMLRELAERHPRKFVLHLSESNEGITSNSNSALALCRGKYVAWMGGDDLMLPGKIRRQVEYMEAYPQCTICYHNIEVFESSSGSVIGYQKSGLRHNGDVRVAIRYGSFNNGCSTMVRLNYPVKVWFDPLLPVASDWLYWVEILMEGGEIHYIDEILGRYRRHENNVTKASKHLTQGQVDHLNSCHILLKKYPQLSNHIFYRLSTWYFSLRYILPYGRALLVSFAATPNLKSVLGMLVYVLSFRAVKL